MDKTNLMKRLLATFLEEMEEHVRVLNQEFLALEKSPGERGERLQVLFRTAHSLKGAARSVNATIIEAACHHLEEILVGVRDSRLDLSAELFEVLFASADALEEAGMRLREQQDLAEAPLAALLPRLDEAARGANPQAPSASPRAKTAAPQPAEAIRECAPTVVNAPAVGFESAPAAPPGAGSSAATEHFDPSGQGSVRVAAEKLDTLLARIGELLVARRRFDFRLEDLARVRDHVNQWQRQWRGSRAPAHVAEEKLRSFDKQLERLETALAADRRHLDQVTAPLDDEVRRVRMLPFAQACEGLERTVRDLAQAAGKDVQLVLEGGSVELDRSILEGLKDPLRHLVRNAVDHGIEAPARRRAAGKPNGARITVAAALRGAQVEVSVEDDGRGLDLEALAEQARRRRLPETADVRELAQLVFLPGLSTAPIITDVSGRGVGLDVVKSRVEALHGTVDLSFTPARGTRFTLTLPLTLTTLRAVLVTAGGQTYALAGTNVHKLARVGPDDFRSAAGRPMLALGGAPLPVAALAAVLDPRAASPPLREGKTCVLIVAAGEQRMAFTVDSFVAEQEILIKRLGARIRRMRLIAGASLLASGRIALVLNAANLIRSGLRRAPERAPASAAADNGPARKRLLVVEDSVTTRTLMKSILEAAGYHVATAVDGQAGWQLLQEQEIDLVVSDVEMPHMDGFTLAETIRGSPRLRELPVVLVTARESDADKARGIAAGADAYLAKSAFDQSNLLETIGQLL